MKIFAINPGSTSTKVGLFEERKKLFERSVSHDAQTLAKPVGDQLEGRVAFIRKAVEEAGYDLADVQAFSGRGGGLVICEGGVYEVNDVMLADAKAGKGALHPACLGSQIAHAFAKQYGGRAFIVSPPDTDEFDEVSRITGLAHVYRASQIHTLNQKEVGLCYAEEHGKAYEDLNLVIAHLGGGISVTAHRKGRMVDSSSNVKGEGPMAPTRAGTVPAVQLIEECFSGAYTKKEMIDRIQRGGGWMEHLGTPDGREVCRRIEAGDARAKLIYEATIHQIAKSIGAYATVLYGEVDAILLTGGLAHDGYFTDEITKRVKYIAPVYVYAGEKELEALASGALRAMRGEACVKTYTGIPVWQPQYH